MAVGGLAGGERRQRILDEALTIVGAKGYHGFGIQELAQRCGLTKPGLLHHFGSKDQMLIALLHDRDGREEADLNRVFLPTYEEAGDPLKQRDVFRRALRALVERSLTQPALMRLQVVLRAEAINPDHPAHAYFQARQQNSLEHLETAAKPFSKHPKSLARQILATMYGLQTQWLQEEGAFDLIGEWDRALDVIFA